MGSEMCIRDRNCKVLVEMEGTPEEDSPSAEYVDSMREHAQFVWA